MLQTKTQLSQTQLLKKKKNNYIVFFAKHQSVHPKLIFSVSRGDQLQHSVNKIQSLVKHPLKTLCLKDEKQICPNPFICSTSFGKIMFIRILAKLGKASISLILHMFLHGPHSSPHKTLHSTQVFTEQWHRVTF